MAIPQHPAGAAFPDRTYRADWATAWAAVVVPVVYCCPVYQDSAADFVDPVDSVVAGYSSPAADPGFAAGCFVIVDSAVAVDSAATVFAAADPDFAVAVDLASSAACPVCSVAAERGKGRAAVAAFCLSALQFFFLRSRSCPLPLCFAVRA